jgi:hypothetical protein
MDAPAAAARLPILAATQRVHESPLGTLFMWDGFGGPLPVMR